MTQEQDRYRNSEPTAHMIDVEQEMFLGCSATELKYAGAVSVAGWIVFLLLLFALLDWYLILAPVLGMFLGLLTAWRVASWIGDQKRGKPHLYYLHKLEVDVFSRLRPSPFVLHEGTWALGRTKTGGKAMTATTKKKGSSAFKSREEELKRDIRYRDRLIIGLLLGLVVAIVGLARAPHVIDVYQAPDLRYGRVSEPGEIPAQTVYLFAKDIFTTLNQWESDGAKDYEKNRFTLRAFLTPQYQRQIRRDIQERLDNHELRGRTREVTTAPGAAYSEQMVKILGPDAWVVYLDLRIREYVDNRNVKDTYVRYPLRVVRYSISREFNPWQLALDGYASTPERLVFDDDAKQQAK